MAKGLCSILLDQAMANKGCSITENALGATSLTPMPQALGHEPRIHKQQLLLSEAHPSVACTA